MADLITRVSVALPRRINQRLIYRNQRAATQCLFGGSFVLHYSVKSWWRCVSSVALCTSLDVVYRKKKNICSFFIQMPLMFQVNVHLRVPHKSMIILYSSATWTEITTVTSGEVVPCTHFCKHSGERPCTQYSASTLCCDAREVEKACGEGKKPKLGSLRGGRSFNREADLHLKWKVTEVKKQFGNNGCCNICTRCFHAET